MNSWKLIGIVGQLTREAINKGLGIQSTEIYKVVKSISTDGTIETHNGKKYKLKLEEITDETNTD